MVTLLSYLRAMIISFEFAVVLCAALVLWTAPPSVGRIIEEMRDPQEFLKWVSFVPVGLLSWNLRLLRSFLLPNSDRRQLLIQWPGYRHAKAIFYASLSYSVLWAGFALAAWVVETDAYVRFGIVLSVAGFVGALVTTFSTYLAEISINEALESAEL